VPYFSIQGYEPQWLTGRRSIAAHGERLRALVGRRLRRAWLAWDLDADEWFADIPVLLDFDGEQVEINHQKFDELSITWNTVDPVRHATWTDGDPDAHAFRFGWRHDAVPELAAFQGHRLQTEELLEWVGRDVAAGMVAPSFVFEHGRLTVSNALDENSLEFGDPDPRYVRR
jgi:hypothetical protein